MRNLKKQHNLSTFFVQSIDIDPGTAADIIFSDGKYGRNIAVERMKNLFAVLKKELKNKCFYLD